MRTAYLATSERLAALTGQQGLVKDPEAPQQHEVTLHSNAPPTHHATRRESGEVEQRREKGEGQRYNTSYGRCVALGSTWKTRH